MVPHRPLGWRSRQAFVVEPAHALRSCSTRVGASWRAASGPGPRSCSRSPSTGDDAATATLSAQSAVYRSERPRIRQDPRPGQGAICGTARERDVPRRRAGATRPAGGAGTGHAEHTGGARGASRERCERRGGPRRRPDDGALRCRVAGHRRRGGDERRAGGAGQARPARRRAGTRAGALDGAQHEAAPRLRIGRRCARRSARRRPAVLDRRLAAVAAVRGARTDARQAECALGSCAWFLGASSRPVSSRPTARSAARAAR